MPTRHLLIALLQSAALPAAATRLGVAGSRFTLDGRPTFLLGISYYAGLGAPDRFVRQDLADMKRYGFNWLRVWATWNGFGSDISAVGRDGGPREPYLAKLRWLVAECDRRGLVVDVTLTRNGLADQAAHRRAVETIITALQGYHNWYLDLANERDVGDARHVGLADLTALRADARRLAPSLLVTASSGVNRDNLPAYLATGVDFLAPHRPRGPESPSQTAAATRELVGWLKDPGRTVPIHYQEPFRRGYTRGWEPTAADFRLDLAQAKEGGAAGWCFHNGSQQGAPGEQPRRSFDLGEKRLFDQLDPEERRFVGGAACETGKWRYAGRRWPRWNTEQHFRKLWGTRTRGCSKPSSTTSSRSVSAEFPRHLVTEGIPSWHDPPLACAICAPPWPSRAHARH